MSDRSEVHRLQSELRVAKACEVLEAAREAWHADRGDNAARKAFRKAEGRVAELRQAHRVRFPVTPAPGDAAPKVETVKARARSERP